MWTATQEKSNQEKNIHCLKNVHTLQILEKYTQRKAKDVNFQILQMSLKKLYRNPLIYLKNG